MLLIILLQYVSLSAAPNNKANHPPDPGVGTANNSSGFSPDPTVAASFDELQQFITELPNNVLKKGLRNSLTKKLRNAKKAYNRGQPCVAANILRAYLNQTQALRKGKRREIAEELRDLLEQVYFHRHLDLRGIRLASNEFQISLSGDSVGFGIAQSEEFIHRVKDVESLFYRTVERKLGKKFRERGRRKKAFEQKYELYVSVPRAASFAVSFRIGRSEQLSFPGIDFPQDVIDEMLSCFDFFNSSQMESLKDRIADSSYFRNFVGLARNIAPDGKEIKSVGFTTLRDGSERKIVLSTPRSKISIPETIKEKEPESIRVEVRGTLRFADARSESEGFIELLEPDGKKHRIKVPRGMMSDIVRPMFEEDVVVSGYEQKGIITLDNIEPAE